MAALLAGLGLLAAGCIFSPDTGNGGGGGGGGGQYRKLDSPANVLDALRLAYAARDSVEYKQLYDSSYVGTSTDLNDPPGTQVSTFRYADEVAHVAALQRSTSINSVSFDPGPETTWKRLPSDDPSYPEWAVIQINTGNLRIEINDNDGLKTYTVTNSNPITFSFKPTVTAPGDTLWKIVRWNETGQTQPPA